MRRFSISVLALSLLAGALAAIPPAASAPGLPELALEDLLAIAQVDAPPAGTGLLIHADFPIENPLVLDGTVVYSLTADITPEGQLQTRSAVTGATVAGAPAAGECNDPAFTPTGVFWDKSDLPVRWWFRRASVPEGTGRYPTQRSLRKAHQIWPRQVTECNNPDPNGFGFSYQGPIHRRIEFDGYNTVDFGKLDHALAVSYTWYRGTRIAEVDLRFNKAQYKWTNRLQGRYRYQVLNVATHELGHALGLDDLSDPHGGLTMFGAIGKGEIAKATLGKGDLKGAETVSP